MFRAATLLAFVTLVAATACKSSTSVTTTTYLGSLSGPNEVPATTSTATGTFTGTLDANNILTYSLSFNGLTSNSTGAHIHGPATSTQATGVLVNFANPPAGATVTTALTLGATSGSTSGSLNLSLAISATVSGDSLRKLLDAGLLYANVHSTNNPGGEIRAQIIKQ